MSELFLRSLLEYYGISLQDLSRRSLPRSFSSLKCPDGLPEYDRLIQRIESAIQSQEKMVIYGDYDVDGLTSVAILVSTLLARGIKAGYFVPSRYKEGYGLNKDRVLQFHEKGYHLILTVDNGVSAHEAIDLAYSLGMEVVIIDHHEITDLPRNAGIFHQIHSGFLSYNCSAASLCYFVSRTLLGRDDPYFATLAGLAVYSDVMPMKENNLTMVKIALDSLRKYRYPNLISLLEAPSKEITYSLIPYQIVPVLNAIGRVRTDSLSTNHAARFLIEKDNSEIISRYSEEFRKINQEKKEAVRNSVPLSSYTLDSSHASTYRMNGPSGLSGLLANRMMQTNHKPTLVFMENEKDNQTLVGSIRLPSGYDGMKFLKDSQKYLLAGGGHKQAIGLTIEKKYYYQVATLFSLAMEGQALNEEKKKTIPLSLFDINEENYSIYQRFEPFGEGFEEPEFSLTVERGDLAMLPSGKALVALNHSHGKALAFQGMELLRESRYESFELRGKLSKESFRGETTYVLKADDISGNLS